MALTVSLVKQTVFGDERVVIADITFDSSYATGGEALVPADLGLTTIDHFTAGTGNVSTAFYVTQYVASTNKLITFTGAAQTASTTDLSTLTVRVKVIGK